LGREALYFYLIAPVIFLFGIGVWQIHLVSALIGILTCLIFWFFIKELFNWRLASLASFFLATSSWHTTISRTGFRAILVPLFLTLFFYFVYLIYKSEKKKKLFSVLAGISLAFGFYTYIAFRVIIGIIGFLAIILFLKKREIFKKFKKEILIGSLTTLIVLAPLIFYFIFHPGYFMTRTSCVSIFNPDLNQGDLLGTFLSVLKKTFLMFFFEGDLNWRHNVSGFPMLNPLVSSLFLFGLIFAFYNLLKKKSFKYLFLICWFFFMLFPQILTAQAIPHGLRSIGTIPVLFVFPALALNFFWEKMESFFRLKSSKIILKMAFIFLLFSSLLYNFSLYFNISANSPEFYYAYRSDLTVVSDYLNKRNLPKKTYLVLDKYSVQTPDFLTAKNNQPYILVDPATSYQIKLEPGDQIIFTQSTIFDAKKFEKHQPEAKLIKKEFNKFFQEIMRVYER
jgi:4-amino-4-deoxy-L-arabinose transferase-like glycosyltransferase